MIDRLALDLPVLHEARYEIVLVKPAGMASELNSSPAGVLLMAWLRRASHTSANIQATVPRNLVHVPESPLCLSHLAVA